MTPKNIRQDDPNTLCTKLEPMLRTLVGRSLTQGLLDDIRALV